ncbi:TRAP transporter small permease [Gilvimarinus agarilyticus]|uniref:TRAP transporter small permease n=1 Tax=Gilvimarinus sp. 2_MG-2023 TaxID=3062666 RepID=UPI001C090F36|nr:TRAP transporter small permease [Gilvimarinus sp. 2_MG-2023]MBU2887720.1 TRAP transporter small permease [Gilvimarinus agarilyticus]MDO6572367.1 TRAP transporter small permease [Gilvimarinus sp. 2_MG-2023]
MEQNAFSEFEPEPESCLRDYKAEDWVALTAFSVLALTVFAQFFSRYVLGSSLGWTEEVSRYLMIAVGFLGAGMGVRKNTHIFVSLFVRLLPEAMAAKISIVCHVITSLFFCVLVVFALQIIPRIHIYVMASMPVPMSVLYIIVLIGLLVMFVRNVQETLQLCKQVRK